MRSRFLLVVLLLASFGVFSEAAEERVLFILPDQTATMVSPDKAGSVELVDDEGREVLRLNVELRRRILSEIGIRNGGVGKNTWLNPDVVAGGSHAVLVIKDDNGKQLRLKCWDDLTLKCIVGDEWFSCSFPFFLVLEDRMSGVVRPSRE